MHGDWLVSLSCLASKRWKKCAPGKALKDGVDDFGEREGNSGKSCRIVNHAKL